MAVLGAMLPLMKVHLEMISVAEARATADRHLVSLSTCQAQSDCGRKRWRETSTKRHRSIAEENRRGLTVSAEHRFNRSHQGICIGIALFCREHLLEFRGVALRVSHWPERRSCQLSLALHQAM